MFSASRKMPRIPEEEARTTGGCGDEQENARTDSPGANSNSSLVSSLKDLVREYEMDQNFPTEIIDRARKYLDDRKQGTGDPELAKTIVAEFDAQKDLILNNSAYPEVRAIVDPTDDPTLPVGTFRVLFIGTLFTIIGTAIQQFFSLRLPSIHISTYVVQLLSMPLGVLMAKLLPKKVFRIGSFSFTLNPGPFNQKEHVLIAIMANVAFGGHSTGAYVVSIIQVLKLDRFYGEKVLSNSIPWQIVTLLATQLIGYGCAGMARRFLVYPASMIWQKSLATLALTKALYKDDGQKGSVNAHGWKMSRYRFFMICFTAMFCWYWVPNFLFEGLALFNWPTWIAPGSVTLALIAGSTCGLGINPLPTLDWNIATYLGDPIITPLFTLMNSAVGMAIAGFIITPILYFNNVFNTAYFPINGNRVYDNSGNYYDVKRILTSQLTLNETAYYEYSMPLVTATQFLNFVFFFPLYLAVPTHIILWHRKDIIKGIKGMWPKNRQSDEFNDIHNRLMSAYPECPHWWYLVILAVSFILACISVTMWPTGMPIWGIVLALIFTMVLQIPIGMLAAITNMEISTSLLAMVVGGYALEGRTIPNMIFKMFSFMSASQSLNFVSDLKLAHYAKIPPRWAFGAQIYATFIAGFVALGVNHWVLRNITDLCDSHQKERFTCPHAHGYFMASVIWGVVGPRRLFGVGGPYHAVVYLIPMGVILPVLVYFLSRKWPRSFWRNVNAPTFLAGPLGWSPYNWSYMQGTVVMALFFNYFIKRRYKTWWERYAYVLTSSFIAAIGISGLVMFFALQRAEIRLDWWGNQIAKQGVDQGGFLDANNSRVRCSHLKIPESGQFDIGFNWKI